MSNARFSDVQAPADPACRVVALLKAAQELTDQLYRPELGARLQEVIDALGECDEGRVAAA